MASLFAPLVRIPQMNLLLLFFLFKFGIDIFWVTTYLDPMQSWAQRILISMLGDRSSLSYKMKSMCVPYRVPYQSLDTRKEESVTNICMT
jgi:hypothetical protein